MFKGTCITRTVIHGDDQKEQAIHKHSFVLDALVDPCESMKRRLLLIPLCILLVLSLVITFIVLTLVQQDMSFDLQQVRLAYYTINQFGANATIETTVVLRNDNYMSVDLRDITLSGTHPAYTGILISGQYPHLMVHMRSWSYFHFPIEAQYLLENDKNRGLLNEVTSKCSENLNNVIPFDLNINGKYETWVKSGRFEYKVRHNLVCSSFITPELLRSVNAFIPVQ